MLKCPFWKYPGLSVFGARGCTIASCVDDPLYFILTDGEFYDYAIDGDDEPSQ